MAIYDTIGTSYNSTRRADPYIAGRMHEFLSVTEGGLYLDIGCGTGNYLRSLTDMGAKFYGVDPSEFMLAEARRKNPDATFIHAKAEHIPLMDGCFSGALAMFTLHHWEDKLQGL